MVTIQQLTDKSVVMLLRGGAAFLIAMAITPIYTYFAYKYKWWKQRRVTDVSGGELKVVSAQSLSGKRTIPRMAGMVTLVAVAVITLIWNWNRAQTWLPLAAMVGGGLIGLIDDIANIVSKNGKIIEFSPKLKLALITLVAAIGAWFFYWKLGYHELHIPFVVQNVNVGLWLVPLFILAVVSTANAVNISDGLDGLAGGLLISAYAAFAVIALFEEKFAVAGFCMTVVGALMSYLWFNIAPARFFMGDIGSFALGTGLGVVAMLTNSLILLPIIGLVFVAEAGSSLLQILSKKILHRRIFIAAPIHHHFEALGWEKTKITMRFWLLGQICALVAIVLAFAGGFVKS